MAITSYPFDNQDTSETDYSRLFRELQDSGVADTIGGTGFAVSADASGMNVFVQAGFALLRGHAVLSTSIVTLSISAAASQLRIDRIVLRLDPVANSITPVVLGGVPGASAPALTQTDTGIFEIGLAQVSVQPGALTIASDKVADDRTYIGSRVGAWTTATRPTSPRRSRLGLNTTSNRWEFWDGSQWTDLAPVVDWATIAGKPQAFAPSPHRHDWNDLDNMPSSFTPASHKHPWADVTGKPPSYWPSAHQHAWSELTSVPASFPPSAHTHSELDVANLRADLDWLGNNKASASHGHDAPWTVGRANGSDRVHGYSPAGSGWYAVWCDGNRDFCHNTSSIRYKENVRDYRIDPEAVLALRPVIYDRKATWHEEHEEWQEGQKNEFGLIAEEVAEAVPEIVQWMDKGDGEGDQIESLRYDLLPVAMLPLMQRQEAEIKDLQAQVANLSTLVQELLARGGAS